MTNFLLLNKISLLSFFGINKTIHSNDKKSKIKLASFGIGGVLLVAAMLFTSLVYSVLLSSVFAATNSMHLQLGVMMVASSVVMLITTIYKVNGFMFGSKDYDMVMALPIKVSTVVASKSVTLYLMNILFELVLMIPACIVYVSMVEVNLMFYVLFIIGLIFIPFIPITIATIIGTILTWISSKFKSSKKIEIVLNILLVLVLFFVSMNISRLGTASEEQLAGFAQMLEKSIYALYPIADWFVVGVTQGDYAKFILFIGLSALAYGLLTAFVTVEYKKINTLVLTSKTSSNYKHKESKISTPFKALLKREFKLYTSSNVYVVNTSFGLILLIIGCVYLMFNDVNAMFASMGMPDEMLSMIKSISPYAIAFIVGTVSTTCCSISMEGKSLWLIKSLPIPSKSILLSKLTLNLILTVPISLIASAVVAFKLGLTGIDLINVVLFPLVITVFVAMFGLIINVLMPIFDWESDVKVVKQSVASFIGIFGGMVMSVICIIPVFLITQIQTSVIVLCVTIFLSIINVLLYLYLTKVSVKAFNKF